MSAETSTDNSHSDTAVLEYAMCVNKVLQMQRVFLTEHEDNSNQPSDSTSTAVPAEGTQCEDASVADSSSLTMDTASVVDSLVQQAAGSDEVTLLSETAAVVEMDLSLWQTCNLI